MVGSSPERFIVLRPSMIVPIEPYLLLHRLEAAGFTFRLAPDNVPEVAFAGVITSRC